jgi:hypothetical protein
MSSIHSHNLVRLCLAEPIDSTPFPFGIEVSIIVKVSNAELAQIIVLALQLWQDL